MTKPESPSDEHRREGLDEGVQGRDGGIEELAAIGDLVLQSRESILELAKELLRFQFGKSLSEAEESRNLAFQLFVVSTLAPLFPL